MNRVFSSKSSSLSVLCPSINHFLQDVSLRETLFHELTQSAAFGTPSISNDRDTSFLRPIFDNYYWPLYCYVKDRLVRFQSNYQASSCSPLIIGLSAPQGCGKTTVTNLLRLFFQKDNTIQSCIGEKRSAVNCIAVSLDDFYLTGAEQDHLAQERKHNPLLQYRGNAGTHDVNLIRQTLDNMIKFNGHLSSSSTAGSPSLLIPRYSKVLREGRGDRLPLESWTKIDEPVDIVLFEGWMLGFSAFPHSSGVNGCASSLEGRISELNACSDERVRDFAFQLVSNQHNDGEQDGDRSFICFKELNELLKEYHFLHDSRTYIHEWIILALADTSAAVVHRWRLEAEHQARDAILANMKDEGSKELLTSKIGLSDKEVYDFVARFMPAYQLYLPYLYTAGPVINPLDRTPQVLKIIVDDARLPIGFQIMN